MNRQSSPLNLRTRNLYRVRTECIRNTKSSFSIELTIFFERLKELWQDNAYFERLVQIVRIRQADHQLNQK